LKGWHEDEDENEEREETNMDLRFEGTAFVRVENIIVILCHRKMACSNSAIAALRGRTQV
jgi:hypothetical protein